MSSPLEGVRPMRAAAVVSAALLAAIALAAQAAPVRYELPPETAVPAPGPHVDVVQANCVACHSFDYITTQPRGLPDPQAFWTAEVTKMRTAYGAPIDPADVRPIVEYLVAVYGK